MQQENAGNYIVGENGKKFYRKGVSGNPAGKPKALINLREEAAKHGLEAIARLVDAMRSDDDRVAVVAAKELLDRGFGKPSQNHDLGLPDGAGGKLVISWQTTDE